MKATAKPGQRLNLSLSRAEAEFLWLVLAGSKGDYSMAGVALACQVKVARLLGQEIPIPESLLEALKAGKGPTSV